MSKALDRLTLLETFVRVAERGSISAAARDLGMSQGSASRQLKDLEERLGVQLVRRTTHSLALSQAGLETLADARELIAGWQALEERHAPEQDMLRGPLGVVAPVALGQLHLADIAIGFQSANPDVFLNWRLDDESIRFAEVGCDCWIKIGRIPDETLIVRRLAEVERMLVATPELASRLKKPRPQDAKRLPFVTLTPFEGTAIRLSGADGKTDQIAATSVMAMNNIMAVKRAVVAGTGAAVLPRWFVSDELGDGRLVDLLPDWRAATLDLNVGFLPTRRQPRRLAAFLDALKAGVRQVPGLIVSSNDRAKTSSGDP